VHIQLANHPTAHVPDPFAVAGFLVILIALLTMSFQSIRAAIANPVNNLKTE
jgi:hypothetical protein